MSGKKPFKTKDEAQKALEILRSNGRIHLWSYYNIQEHNNLSGSGFVIHEMDMGETMSLIFADTPFLQSLERKTA